MKDKILDWFGRNRKTTGYICGGLNTLAGLIYAVQGNYGQALFWLTIGGIIVLNTGDF